ncbi:DNA (cytosine-5-)-methyltransferase [Streptomyces sp. AV19]|uniref:DNA cytosine methyltransferase n=1 Tax=Streptomyces sp. AV19 TaxID=2793068 RepID=UPI001F3718E9|nr:DNA (cytosine-5-)-methyltransferase [Streptomyces sp. AV19]
MTSIEICAGAGGQAVGLHNAHFGHLALVEWDQHAVNTLKENVVQWPGWDKERADALKPMDVKEFLSSGVYENLGEAFTRLGANPQSRVDLLAGGVPCPPFSLAGKQLGADDERDLFPDMLKIVEEVRPNAVMIENVRGILEPPAVFIEYRRWILDELRRLGYVVPEVPEELSPEAQDEVMRSVWRKVEARDFGVPQLRPRAILVAFHERVEGAERFVWPKQSRRGVMPVLEALEQSMLDRCKVFWDKNFKGEIAGPDERTGQDVFDDWRTSADKAKTNATDGVAPTLVGGSKKHGGADLGPSRAKKAWAAMGVDATGVANDDTDDERNPERDLFRPVGPMLTVQQAAKIQGFPDQWRFKGRKTARYRQVGNAFPPPVAEAIGRAIAAVLRPDRREELLKDYVMEGQAGGATGDMPGNVVVPASRAPEGRAAGQDRSRDLIGAEA